MQSIWAGNLGRCVQHFPTCWVVQETNIDLNHFVVLMEFLIIDQHWLRILLKSARQFSETLFKGNFLESDDFKGAFWAIFLSVFFNFSSKTILVPFEWSKKKPQKNGKFSNYHLNIFWNVCSYLKFVTCKSAWRRLKRVDRKLKIQHFEWQGPCSKHIFWVTNDVSLPQKSTKRGKNLKSDFL